MRMLPPTSLTVPDVQFSRFRFFMEELCSRRCSDGRCGLPAEDDVVGVQRTGSWEADSCDPAATTISARSSQPDGRTSLCVESCRFVRYSPKATIHGLSANGGADARRAWAVMLRTGAAFVPTAGGWAPTEFTCPSRYWVLA